MLARVAVLPDDVHSVVQLLLGTHPLTHSVTFKMLCPHLRSNCPALRFEWVGSAEASHCNPHKLFSHFTLYLVFVLHFKGFPIVLQMQQPSLQMFYSLRFDALLLFLHSSKRQHTTLDVICQMQRKFYLPYQQC